MSELNTKPRGELIAEIESLRATIQALHAEYIAQEKAIMEQSTEYRELVDAVIYAADELPADQYLSDLADRVSGRQSSE